MSGQEESFVAHLPPEGESSAAALSLFDTHAHLDLDQFAPDRREVLARARRAGVEAILCPAISADSSAAVVRLAHTELGVLAAVGIQPNYAGQAAPGDWDRVVALAAEPRVVALGETGLDRHWDFTPLEVQQDYFDRHLRLAQARDLPLIVHCRDAQQEVLGMLREAAGRGPLRGVLHAFSGDRSFAEELTALGFWISFAGAVTYANERFERLRQAARFLPVERILIETDSPYLVPEPLRGKQRRNEPAQLLLVARCLAGLRGVGLEPFAAQTAANARQLFRLA
ncbi:MAG: TatD family hydrolase [Thermoguttaceae bacterium]